MRTVQRGVWGETAVLSVSAMPATIRVGTKLDCVRDSVREVREVAHAAWVDLEKSKNVGRDMELKEFVAATPMRHAF